MFDDVAARYDLMNTLLTGGQVYVWRAAVKAALELAPGMKVLDSAAGTGTSSNEYLSDGIEVVPLDFSVGMMTVGKKRYPHLDFIAGDAMALPFADESFDRVTISYGLRNVHDTQVALKEMLRVTKPGGQIVIAEFSRPTWAPFRTVYEGYLEYGMPLVSKLFSSDKEAYDYLAESILAWPAQKELARIMQESGWRSVEYRNLSGGIVALHRATKPE